MSLQDQLRLAGLVKEKQVKNVKKRQHAEQVQRRKTALPVIDPLRQLAQAQLAEKAEQDRLLNLKREEKLKARALAAEIRQIVETHRVPRAKGDIAYNFVMGTKIKKMYLNAEQRDDLMAGRLRVVVTGDQFDLVPPAIAEKIHARDARRVAPPPHQQGRQQSEQPGDRELDDHYAKFKVPDDLDW